MFDYFREGSWALQRVRLEYLGGAYDGRGLLTWNPTDGFHLDAFLERSGPPLPSVIEWGKPRVFEPWEFRHVRMQMAPGFRAISAPIVVSDHAELIGDPRLEADFFSVLFLTRLPKAAQGNMLTGRAVYDVGKSLALPDPLVTESRITGHRVNWTSSRAGLRHEDDRLEIVAHLESDRCLQVDWLLSGALACKANAWGFAEAFALALSIVSGRTIHLLERTHARGETEYCERRCRQDVTYLGLLRPLPERDTVDRDAVVAFVKAFLTDARCADISRWVFQQLAEASRQQTHVAQELLCATILEAILRTVDGRAFVQGDKSWKLPGSLKIFQEKYLGNKWKKARVKALGSQRRIRDRNAHPEWLTVPGALGGAPPLEESLNDLVFLSTFYGYMLLALAGFKDLEPRFPKPMKDWRPAMTITSGASTEPESTMVEDATER
jgi:hypothetical protein